MSFQRLDPEHDPRVQAAWLLDMCARRKIGSIHYYLYRQIGCPKGDSLQGLVEWCNEQEEGFAALIQPVRDQARLNNP